MVFPSDFDEKDQKWHLKVAQNMHQIHSSGSHLPTGFQNRIDELEQVIVNGVSSGKVRNNAVSTFEDGSEQAANRKKGRGKKISTFEFQHRPLRFGVKFINAVVGVLQKARMRVQLTAIDSMAKMQRRDFELGSKAMMFLAKNIEDKRMLEEVGAKMGIDIAKLPTNEDELHIALEQGPVMEEAINTELCLEDFCQKNQMEERTKELLLTLAVQGAGLVDVRTEGENDRVLVPHLKDCVWDPNFQRNKAFRYAGYYRYMTLAEVSISLAESLGRELNDVEKKFLEAKVGQVTTGENQQRTGADTIKILYYQYLSLTELVLFDDPTGIPMQMWFEGYYLPDSNFLWGTGPAKGQYRDRFPANPGDASIVEPLNALSSIAIFMPGLIGEENVSLAEQMEPILEKIDATWYNIGKIQHGYIPRGFKVDWDAVATVTTSSNGGEGMSKMQILNLFRKEGIWLYSGKSYQKDHHSGNDRGISVLDVGMSGELDHQLNFLTQLINMLREITGISGAVEGSTPMPDTGKGVMEMMQEGTGNVLYDIGKCRIDMFLHCNRVAGSREMFRAGVRQGSVGEKTYTMGEKERKRIYGYNVELLPTEERKREILTQISSARGVDEISWSDMFVIQNEQNFKRAQQILGVRADKREKTKHQRALELQTAQGESASMATQTASELQMKTLQMEAQIKAEEALRTQQHEANMKLLDYDRLGVLEREKHEYRLREIELTAKLAPKPVATKSS